MSAQRMVVVVSLAYALCVPGPLEAQELPPEPPEEIETSEGAEGRVDMRGAMNRYDFDRGEHILWGGVGGLAGLGGAALVLSIGFGINEFACDPDVADACEAVVMNTSAVLALSSFIAGPFVATNLTGGPRANGWTHLASVGGWFLAYAGGLYLVNDVLELSFTSSDAGSFSPDSVTAIGVGLGLITLMGMSTALFYQLAYPGPEPVTLAPMILKDGGGLVLGGRF